MLCLDLRWRLLFDPVLRDLATVIDSSERTVSSSPDVESPDHFLVAVGPNAHRTIVAHRHELVLEKNGRVV